jgi:hypothetical protein
VKRYGEVDVIIGGESIDDLTRYLARRKKPSLVGELSYKGKRMNGNHDAR